MKTIAARMLDQMTIAYELREYAWSEDELEAVSVASLAGATGATLTPLCK